MKHLLFIVLVLYLVNPSARAQHTENSHQAEHADHVGNTHKLTLVMANSFLKNNFEDRTNSVLVVPTFGFNYDFLFHPKWGVGLHSDIVLQQYKVEKHDGHETIVRENPVALCAMGLFSPIPSLTLLAGYGIELEAHEHIQLFRFGVEYGFHLPKHWELGVMLEFDRKINTYKSWVFGVGFSKLLTSN
jgi:hypothetical protein